MTATKRMRPVGIAAAAVALMMALTASSTPTAGDWIYLFTQQHRDALYWWRGTWMPQTVPTNAHIQVQLPATPVHWKLRDPEDCEPTKVPQLPLGGRAELIGTGEFPNEGRIDGTSTIETFDFRLTGVGAVAVCLDPDPPTDDPSQIGLPAGPTNYVLTLLVGVPQVNLKADA
ncbi:hypothetical protein GCM10009799_38440 [Nocardiopsis rhodophaea]|uniref:Secreted protein n=1 Tax=Nocardiopsis rhodophaea TaxID=280238 RepID=A0ABP5EV30_9ACTN